MKNEIPLACFPIQFEPTNFFDILIGSQLSMMLRKFLRVVPSVRGNSPALNSWINLFFYIFNKRRRIMRQENGEGETGFRGDGAGGGWGGAVLIGCLP